MDQLLNQEELNVRPVQGRFDVDQVAQAIQAMPHAWRDEFVPDIFLVFLDDEMRDQRAAQRRANPAAPLPYVLLIRVQPELIQINQFAGPDYAGASRAFIEWLAQQHRCTVHNEAGKDLSPHWPAPR